MLSLVVASVVQLPGMTLTAATREIAELVAHCDNEAAEAHAQLASAVTASCSLLLVRPPSLLP